MSNGQEEALIKLYKGMTSTQIEQRLAGRGLIDLARGVAENELQLRKRDPMRGPVDIRSPVDSTRSPVDIISSPVTSDGQGSNALPLVALLVSCLLLIGFAVLRPDLAMLISVLVIPPLTMLLGKKFPVLGYMLGGVMIVAAIAIVANVVFFHRRTRPKTW
jgi:hypothetical protein